MPDKSSMGVPPWEWQRSKTLDSHDFFRFWCARFLGTSKLARAFGARPWRLVYSVYLVYFWGFCPFQFFIVYIYIVPLPNILASRIVASLAKSPKVTTSIPDKSSMGVPSPENSKEAKPIT